VVSRSAFNAASKVSALAYPKTSNCAITMKVTVAVPSNRRCPPRTRSVASTGERVTLPSLLSPLLLELPPPLEAALAAASSATCIIKSRRLAPESSVNSTVKLRKSEESAPAKWPSRAAIKEALVRSAALLAERDITTVTPKVLRVVGRGDGDGVGARVGTGVGTNVGKGVGDKVGSRVGKDEGSGVGA